MTAVQPCTRWVPRELMGVVCVAVCMLLFATAAQASTPRFTPSPHGSRAASQSTQSTMTARAAAVRTLVSSTLALRTCRHIHPRRCASASREVKRAANRLNAARKHRKSGSQPTRDGTSGTGSRGNSGSSSSGSEANGSTSGGSTSGGLGSTPGSLGSGISETGKSGPESSGATSGSGSPAPGQESPTTADPNFEPGLNSGWDENPDGDVVAAARVGAKLVRIDMSIEDTPQELESVIGAYAAEGIRVLALADFHSALPTPAEAQDLGNWAKTFGPGGTFWAGRSDGQFALRSIEFGNETSYSYQYSNDTPAGYANRAQTYALRFKEAALAIRAANPGVGLLAQGDSGNAGPLWVENMFKAVPNLGGLVAGWTIHPYGPTWRHRLEEVIDETAAQDAPSTIPIDITEWGISTDNGGCVTENFGWNPCMTYNEAGEALTRSVREMHEMLGSRFGMFLLYKDRDQESTGTSTEREAYFGALQEDLQPKGAFTTAIEGLLAS